MQRMDLINGLFEIVGAYFVWRNAFQLYADKETRGVYLPAWGFFAAWGIWNMAYYPSLDQWVSFAAGLFLVSGNIAWVVLAVYYKHALKCVGK